MTQHLSSPLHMIGIYGSGMRALAEYATAQGIVVQGSDLRAHNQKSPLHSSIKVFSTHDPKHIGDCQVVVYSSAITPDNVELKYAKEKGLIVWHRSDLLSYFLQLKKAVTIAGTHGKTTTAAMMACLLNQTQHSCGAIIGGTPKNEFSQGDNKSGFLVAEADESDGSFLKYSSYISVVNNLAKDHMEYFGNTEKLLSVFLQYLNNTQKDGVALLGWDDEFCRNLGQTYTGYKLSYGFTIGCDIRALSYSIKEGRTHYDLMIVKKRVSGDLPFIGQHNLRNAMACFAAGHFLGIHPDDVAHALQSFKGVARRLDVLCETPKRIVIDDYAHNPGKIQAVIHGVRESWPKWPLVVFFQPHRYSRLATLYDEFCSAFVGAHSVHVLHPYAAGEPIDPKFDPQQFVKKLAQDSQTNATYAESFENAVKIAHNISERAILLTVGAGDVNDLAPKFIS